MDSVPLMDFLFLLPEVCSTFLASVCFPSLLLVASTGLISDFLVISGERGLTACSVFLGSGVSLGLCFGLSRGSALEGVVGVGSGGLRGGERGSGLGSDFVAPLSLDMFISDIIALLIVSVKALVKESILFSRVSAYLVAAEGVVYSVEGYLLNSADSESAVLLTGLTLSQLLL